MSTDVALNDVCTQCRCAAAPSGLRHAAAAIAVVAMIMAAVTALTQAARPVDLYIAPGSPFPVHRPASANIYRCDSATAAGLTAAATTGRR